MKTIHDLTIADRNANRGTKRGAKAVADSLTRYGAGRSILTDRHGKIIAGNHTAAAAADAGITDIQIVKTDGSKLVVVQRTDLDFNDPKARELAIADNRTSELGLEWDPEMLAELTADLDTAHLFSEEEYAALTGKDAETNDAELEAEAAPPTGNYKEQYGVIVICADEAEQKKLYERLQAEGLNCRVVVT